ncbi:hypothetical protein LSTR_LSTR017536 [Laodelphax striatellus]|uniref:Uncharacterized protein n=1 Tax=Laodelphax striatellus TaxID=195883 RepID=A0A482XSW2_LAOST|nr:hypothetical protein LSTR_LSTR017536 [Laodelphax striatellus]
MFCLASSHIAGVIKQRALFTKNGGGCHFSRSFHGRRPEMSGKRYGGKKYGGNAASNDQRAHPLSNRIISALWTGLKLHYPPAVSSLIPNRTSSEFAAAHMSASLIPNEQW